MGDASDPDVENAIGKEFVEIEDAKVVQNSREELARLDSSNLSHDEAIAYTDAVEALTYLRESLREPEKRRPNAEVQPWGCPDDD